MITENWLMRLVIGMFLRKLAENLRRVGTSMIACNDTDTLRSLHVNDVVAFELMRFCIRILIFMFLDAYLIVTAILVS